MNGINILMFGIGIAAGFAATVSVGTLYLRYLARQNGGFYIHPNVRGGVYMYRTSPNMVCLCQEDAN